MFTGVSTFGSEAECNTERAGILACAAVRPTDHPAVKATIDTLLQGLKSKYLCVYFLGEWVTQ